MSQLRIKSHTGAVLHQYTSELGRSDAALSAKALGDGGGQTSLQEQPEVFAQARVDGLFADGGTRADTRNDGLLSQRARLLPGHHHA
jgi:hypothetical protein